MKILLMILMLTSCGAHEDRGSKQTITQSAQKAHDKGDFYCSQLTEDAFTERCDKLTFKAMVSVACPQSLNGFENDGRWERDTRQCYPEFSRSTISRDGLISVLHYIWTNQDLEMLERFISYGEERKWIVGDGPTEYTDAILLMPMSYKIRDKLKNISSSGLTELPTIDQIAKGFKGHVLANYIWLSLRVNGSLDESEVLTINNFYNSSPIDPMYVALYHRYADGDQSETYDLLLNSPEFPDGSFPSQVSVFGWGSAPSSVYYLFSLAITEGK